MSEEDSDNKGGFISRLLLKHFKSEAAEKTEFEDDSLRLPSSSEIVDRASFENPDATDPEIVQRAMTRLDEEGGMERKREETDIEMKLEKISDPVGVVEKFNNVVYKLSDSIVEEVRSRQIEEDRGIDTIGGADAEGNKVTSMEYIIYEDEEGILVGGTSNFIRNLCYKLDFSPIELELIKHAQNEAARQTGVDELVAHTISGISVLWVPKKQPDGMGRNKKNVAAEE